MATAGPVRKTVPPRLASRALNADVDFRVQSFDELLAALRPIFSYPAASPGCPELDRRRATPQPTNVQQRVDHRSCPAMAEHLRGWWYRNTAISIRSLVTRRE